MTWMNKASHQWASRPDDERFVSLYDMQEHFNTIRAESRETIASSRRIHCLPDPDNLGMLVTGPNGTAYAPTHWAFGQLAQLAEAPAGYLRTLPAPITADNINYGLQFNRGPEDVGFLLRRNGENILRAATGPRYGRIWNADCLSALTSRFGDGIIGQWTVPGEFGKTVTVTKENTTLFASDRDFFVFLADETNRIEVPNRRNGKPGSLARGFFVWNSEVGSATFGLATFLFDYVCCNRIVWGGVEYKELRLRHTVSAPDKFVEQITPRLLAYSSSSARPIEEKIEAAQKSRISDKLEDFLARRFSKGQIKTIVAAHEREEGRPIETLWDATVAVTAVARAIGHQDQRVTMERQAGNIFDLAA
jgi:hypothetical protein